MVSAYFFGVSGLINAFTVAIQIPNLVRALVADAALSGAFVPVFSELLEKGSGTSMARRLDPLLADAPRPRRPHRNLHPARAAAHAAVRRSGGDYELAVGLSRVLFPIVVLLGLSGIVVGILNTHHQFAGPALAPVAWNLVIVVGLVLGVPRIHEESAQLYLYAGVVVLGTLVQLLLPIPWLRRLDGRLTMVIDWRDPAVKRVLVLMLPVTLTIGPSTSTSSPTRPCVASARPQLAPAAIDKAFRLYMLPQGCLCRGCHDGALPDARPARRARRLRRTAASARRRLRQIAFLLVPAGLVSIVLAQPIVRLVYQRGEFTPRTP
jgi:putative peptidoglycan lipid II flippase